MRNTVDLVKNRLSVMYTLGTASGEVDRCLSESKKLLQLAGAKADNLPVGLERRVHFLVRLQPKPQAIIRNWFKKNLAFEGLDDVASALESIQSANVGSEELEKTKAAWRTLLRIYVHGERNSSVESFLAGADVHPVASSPNDLDKSEPAVIEITDEDADSCIALAEGKPLQRTLRPLPALISGILASMRGDERIAAEHREQLSASNSPLAKKLGLVISAVLSRSTRKPASVVHKLQPYVAGMISSVDGIPFIGIVKTILAHGQTFVSPIALEIAGKWMELSPFQARVLFPNNGDATAAPHSIPGGVVEGEIGVWTADLKSPEKSSRYVISQHLGKVYSVSRVPHSSQEPDEVRRWLIETYKPIQAIVPLFLLTDGVALRLPSGLGDPGKFNFDTPLDCYSGLESIELSVGRLALATNLPPGIGKYHCEPSGTLIKRLFKQAKDSENVPVLGKTQLQALANFANLSSSSVDMQAHTRALESLGNAADAKIFIDSEIQQILGLPEVKARIDAEIAAISKEYAAQQASLKKEVADLAEKRRFLETDIEARKEAAHIELERLKKAGRQQELELERRIKNTFDKAVEGGLETLANTALLKVIVGTLAAPLPKRDSQASPALPAEGLSADLNAVLSESSKSLLNKRALIAAIAVQAEHSGLSEIMILSAVALASARPVIGLTGTNARKAITSLAALMSGGLMCEVSVSGDMFSISDLMNAPALIRAGARIWPATLGAFLETQSNAGRASIIELRGANRTPPESLLPELTELTGVSDGGRDICWKDATGKVRHVSIRMPIVFALTFESGKSVFPVQGTLATFLPLLHTSGPWGDETEPGATTTKSVTSISAEAWNALSKPSEAEGGTQSVVRTQTIFAAEALGLSAPRAQAIAALAFSVGRHVSADLRSEVERLAPDLFPYAAEVLDGDAAKEIRQVFGSELGILNEQSN